MTTPARFRRLLDPLNLAALLTWLAVGASLLGNDSPPAPASVALMLVFLVAYVLQSLIEKRAPDQPRRRELALIALQAVIALALCVLQRNGMVPVLLIVVVAQLAMIASPRVLIAGVVAVQVALYAIFVRGWHADDAWALQLAYGGFQLFAALTAWYARRAQASAEELQLTNAHLLATRALLAESARDQERVRLARELHDVAGHKLTALKLNLALLQRGQEPSPGLVTCGQLAAELLDDIRAVVAQMRVKDGMDLSHAFGQLAAPLPRPRVHIDVADDARADNVAQAEALLRAVQEALTNVARHSDAEQAWVRLRRDDGTITLEVHDDGRTRGPLREGNGLAGMRERVATLGGTLLFGRDDAGGVRLRIDLPSA